ncbi:MAG: hypothetical protein CVV02_10055 [Firmicutes bacterium HGW-Firmicutes-7]|nr:MAG: hypothetical protein CVV02_10055 [Firmicutes bacterium HGW-Firmicutes-7]
MSTCCPNDCIISENISGYIDIKDHLFHTIWQAIDLTASITIKIKNLSNHYIRLKIERNKSTIIKIFPNEEQNITVSNVHNIAVQCSGKEEGNCTGSYQIIIHYPLDFNSCSKRKNFFCEEDVWSEIKMKRVQSLTL